ncbi:hypothetical protein BY458DRAFT_492447 [Sporodiniella umbellata]|nr:hypothetical protein BY458DRAFT_492447 [Sporodiniella umbellata]
MNLPQKQSGSSSSFIGLEKSAMKYMVPTYFGNISGLSCESASTITLSKKSSEIGSPRVKLAIENVKTIRIFYQKAVLRVSSLQPIVICNILTLRQQTILSLDLQWCCLPLVLIFYNSRNLQRGNSFVQEIQDDSFNSVKKDTEPSRIRTLCQKRLSGNVLIVMLLPKVFKRHKGIIYERFSSFSSIFL